MSQKRGRNKSAENLTQQCSGEALVDVHEIANNVVRYIIYRAGEHMLFSRAELTRNVIHKVGNKYEEIMEKVAHILKTVYGYNIMLCNSAKGKDKYYVVSNNLSYINDPSDDKEKVPEDVHKILLLLILSHIFMSDNSVTEVSLYTFLKTMNIDVELRHPVFGQVGEYINKVLIKKQYLLSEIDNISRRQTFKWGVRAEKEISKMEILKFVCKMYKERQPKNWVHQYKIAMSQAFENNLDRSLLNVELE